MDKLFYLFFVLLFAITGCQQKSSTNSAHSTVYPPAQGFNEEASDQKAMAIADSVMQALGGYQAWKDTRIISWNFFGRRTHTWDKHQNRDRIEIPAKNMVIDFNINTRKGSVMVNGEKMSQPDSLSKYLKQGYEMWVNDSYWLIMPYKLKDSGVTLEYMGIEKTDEGVPSHKLKLTFEDVGVTPQNKYHVYVDTTDYLVKQWEYFSEVSNEEPRFVLPWKDYKRHGKIFLSGNRGRFTLSDIRVMDQWPESN